MMAKEKLLVGVHGLVAIIAVLVIGYLNFLLIRFWFFGEFSQNTASIETSYIQMAKFWSDFAGGGWQPLWYLGYPWHVFYTPLLPFLEVVLHNLLDFSYAHAYRVITAFGYVLAPVSIYLFVWQLSKSKTGALVAGLFYTFVPSVISLIFAEVANDRIGSLLEPRRFTILVRWGEGPHTLGLVFLPLFGLFLHRYLGNKRFADLVVASAFLGLIALTNAIVLWAAGLLLLAVFLSELAGGSADLISLVKNVLAVFVLGFGLVAFWYNLPFIGTFFREGGGALNNWLAMFPWGILALSVGFLALFLFLRRFFSRWPQILACVFWFLMLFGIVFTYYASSENRLEYVPQALRLNTEVDLALSTLVGVVFSTIFLKINKVAGKLKIPMVLAAFSLWLLILAGLVFWGNKLVKTLPELTRPLSEAKLEKVENTAEFRVAKKLGELTSESDQRVLVPGNYSFWLNFFEPVPQLRGALFQSSTHFWPEHIYYQLTNGLDSDISLAWLKIANVGKLVYTTIGSAEPFKDFKVPQEKFDKILAKIDQEQGDIFYSVPLKNDSLAKVVSADGYKRIEKPINAIDREPIFAYLAWIEEKSDRRLKVETIDASHYQIEGEVTKGDAVLFQQTYDSGWDVKNGGWKVISDPFDFTLLVPKEAGEFKIDLVYAKPLSVYVGYFITLATFGFVIFRFLKRI